MSATMAVRSGELRRSYGVEAVHLHRWHKAGLIRPTRPAGSHRAGGAIWPDWTWRMAALIRGGLPVNHYPTLRLVAEVLAECPDVPWVVIDEAGVAHACYDAAEVVAVHHRQTSISVVVAIPTLEEACALCR